MNHTRTHTSPAKLSKQSASCGFNWFKRNTILFATEPWITASHARISVNLFSLCWLHDIAVNMQTMLFLCVCVFFNHIFKIITACCCWFCLSNLLIFKLSNGCQRKKNQMKFPNGCFCWSSSYLHYANEWRDEWNMFPIFRPFKNQCQHTHRQTWACPRWYSAKVINAPTYKLHDKNLCILFALRKSHFHFKINSTFAGYQIKSLLSRTQLHWLLSLCLCLILVYF